MVSLDVRRVSVRFAFNLSLLVLHWVVVGLFVVAIVSGWALYSAHFKAPA